MIIFIFSMIIYLCEQVDRVSKKQGNCRENYINQMQGPIYVSGILNFPDFSYFNFPCSWEPHKTTLRASKYKMSKCRQLLISSIFAGNKAQRQFGDLQQPKELQYIHYQSLATDATQLAALCRQSAQNVIFTQNYHAP